MKKLVLLLLVCCSACRFNAKEAPVYVKLINNSRSVKFTGLDPAILGEIGRDTTKDLWENLLPVYHMPADTDLKDYLQPQPGKYIVADTAIVFTPDTPFVKGQTYYLRYYHFDEGKTVLDILKNKRTLGRQPYTDLVFGEVHSR
jgi:hypothetical protein